MEAPLLVRCWWFEPFVATFSFGFWVTVFRIAESRDCESAARSVLDVRQSTQVIRTVAASSNFVSTSVMPLRYRHDWILAPRRHGLLKLTRVWGGVLGGRGLAPGSRAGL